MAHSPSSPHAANPPAGASQSTSKPLRTDELQGDILHEYDGIEEADNFLPKWWLYTLFGSIAFSAVYWFAYHGFGFADLPRESFTKAMAARAEQSADVSNEALEALAQNSSMVEAGKALFVTNCAVCHLENGSGKIGPNLTDAHWIHGGQAEDIYRVINQGVAAKGMPAWGPPLGPTNVRRVVAYTLTLRNTDKPGKAPQGEKVDGEG